MLRPDRPVTIKGTAHFPKGGCDQNMSIRFWFRAAALILAAFLLAGTVGRVRARADRFAAFPRLTVWAWERPEQLGFAPADGVAVAFLAETVYLSGPLRVRPRMQPLQISPGSKRIAVVRVEAPAAIPETTDYRLQVADAIAMASSLSGVDALQIDFDAARSQREFYAALIRDVRGRLPAGLPLSITALASWCMGDRWMSGLPLDEAVPMLFRMGPSERAAIVEAAANGGLREPLCQMSVGLSTDESWPEMRLLAHRRIYLFRPRSWDAETLARYQQRLKQ